MQSPTQFGDFSAPVSVESAEYGDRGWAIAPPDGPLTSSQRTKSHFQPCAFPVIPEHSESSRSDSQRLESESRLVTFASQHALVAAARAGSGSQSSFSRHLALLPSTVDKSGTVSGELTWSNEPINSIYKKLPPPSRSPMIPGQTVELASLPRQLSDVLAKYDTDGDGYLDEKEVMDAVKDMELMDDIVKSGRIPFSSFPAKKQKLLRKHDTNQDEEIDVSEIIHGFEALNREKRRRRQLCLFITGLMVFTLILLIGMSGMLAYIRRLERESDVTDSKMFVKNSDTDVVQTASALFQVKDGVLVDRAFSSQECLAGKQCVRPVSASLASSESVLSSVVSDTDFQGLKSVKILNGDSWIFFRIRSVARYKEPNSRHGSVVVLYTHIGEIQLDGEDIFFHERIAGAFADAGFRVVSGVGNNRRLLGLIKVIGVFNKHGIVPPPQSIPDVVNGLFSIDPSSQEFYANVTKIKICEERGADCLLDDFSMPEGAHVRSTADFGLGMGDALVWEEEQTVKNFSGELLVRTVVRSEQYPQQTRITLQSVTDKMSYQTFEGWHYHCEQHADDILAQALLVGGFKASFEPGIPGKLNITDLGWDEPGGVRCRKYKIQPEPDSQGDVVGRAMYYWEHHAEQRVYQLQDGNMVYRYNTLTADVSDAQRADFEMREAWITCNPEDFNWPQLWIPGRVTSALEPKTAWGKPRQSLEFGHEDHVGVIEVPMEAEDYQDYLEASYTALSVEQEQQRVSDYGGLIAKFCENGTRDGYGPDGLHYTYTLYSACDGGAGRATRLQLDLTDDSDSCFKGSGSIEILREGLTVFTTGSMELQLDVLSCFEDRLDAVILDNLEHLSKQFNSGVATSLPAQLSIVPGVQDFYEDPAACAEGESRKMGYLAGTAVFNGTAETEVNRMFETAVFEKELMTMDSKITVESLVISSDLCAEEQADSNIKIGFRFGLRWTGRIVFNVCKACADAECDQKLRLCYPNQQPEQPPIEFDMYRQIFPGASSQAEADACQTDSNGIYRYQCYHPAEVFEDPYSSAACHSPIGFVSVPNTQCSPP